MEVPHNVAKMDVPGIEPGFLESPAGVLSITPHGR